jgi:hypothetical protein
MTLQERNNFFRAGIALAAVSLAAIAAAAFFTFPAYPAVMEAAARRSSGILQGLAAGLFPPAPHAPFASAAGAGLYALVSLILIYYFFEKTNAPEILFVAIFVLSFALEGLRVMVPLKQALGLPGVYLLMGSRALLFARYFGIFSLFAASVCAAGLTVQKQRNILLVIAVASLVIALGLPIDPLAWDSSLLMLSGYPALFQMVETAIVLITALSFLVSAYSRGSREYIFVGAGSLLAFLGRNLLLCADTWLTPLPGLLILALGTWFVCVRLHRIYLWL